MLNSWALASFPDNLVGEEVLEPVRVLATTTMGITFETVEGDVYFCPWSKAPVLIYAKGQPIGEESIESWRIERADLDEEEEEEE